MIKTGCLGIALGCSLFLFGCGKGEQDVKVSASPGAGENQVALHVPGMSEELGIT